MISKSSRDFQLSYWVGPKKKFTNKYTRILSFLIIFVTSNYDSFLVLYTDKNTQVVFILFANKQSCEKIVLFFLWCWSTKRKNVPVQCLIRLNNSQFKFWMFNLLCYAYIAKELSIQLQIGSLMTVRALYFKIIMKFEEYLFSSEQSNKFHFVFTLFRMRVFVAMLCFQNRFAFIS